MRLTKIVCTLGPASNTTEMVGALAKEGMDIARLNFSHGSHEDHKKTIDVVRTVNDAHGSSIALLLDIRGSAIRTGDVTSPVPIDVGQEVLFAFNETSDPARPVIRVNYGLFAKDVAEAESIILDNGTMVFDVVEIRKDGCVIARSRDEGQIGSRRHINLPGAFVSLPALTEKDWEDLRFGIEQNVDFVALSFIRTAEEIDEVREFLRKKKSDIRIVTKIETRHAVRNIDAIIAASDGIMVARGDLGMEIPFERLPAVQDMIVAKCRQAGKPVIVATHMLESMIEHPMPTRAEVTDIAHAAVSRADATMLSGETAAGKYPVASVRAMSRVLEETETHLLRSSDISYFSCPYGERQALAEAATRMALTLRAPAILVLTLSGQTAQAVSSLRPGIPIIALTEDAGTQRLLKLPHAVFPLTIDFDADPEVTVGRSLAAVRERGLVADGVRVVVVTDAKTKTGSVRTVQVRSV